MSVTHPFTPVCPARSWERRQLYNHMRHLQLLERSGALQLALQDYDRAKARRDVLYQQNDLKVLRGARVVAMTTTGVASHQELLAALAPRVGRR